MKKLILVFLLLIASYYFLFKIYTPRVSAFGCFDDCFSFAAGYFLNHDKKLYTDIFYNHQMLPAYLSSFIQNFSPINLYDLVLKHRQFVLFYGFFFNLILILKFGFPALLFFGFFEISKFYIFGDRFLGENLAVYPLVFLFFLAFKKLNGERLKNYDLILSSIFAWLVIFLREVFTPVSLILFFYILFPYTKLSRIKLISTLLFVLLSLSSILIFNLKDYYFNLVLANKHFLDGNNSYLLNTLLYPLYIFTSSKWNIFRVLLIGIDILFIISFAFLLIRRKFKYLLLSIPLFFANIRVVEPGRIFYEAFHMVPFYALFLSSTFLMTDSVKKFNKKLYIFLVVSSLFVFLNYVFSPHAFFKEKANQHEEFFTNYSNVMHAGEIIKKLSTANDTLFVDGYDEIIYWVANRPSSYKYSMYTSFMPDIPLYSTERLNMFKTTPPNFYYGSCPKEKNPQRLMPAEFKNSYVRLNSFEKPTCIFVLREKISKITSEQWKSVANFGYEIPH